MKQKHLQMLFLILGFVCVIIAFSFSMVFNKYADGVDMAFEGGAIGFAILAGLCFLCVTLIQINFEKVNEN